MGWKGGVGEGGCPTTLEGRGRTGGFTLALWCAAGVWLYNHVHLRVYGPGSSSADDWVVDLEGSELEGFEAWREARAATEQAEWGVPSLEGTAAPGSGQRLITAPGYDRSQQVADPSKDHLGANSASSQVQDRVTAWVAKRTERAAAWAAAVSGPQWLAVQANEASRFRRVWKEWKPHWVQHLEDAGGLHLWAEIRWGLIMESVDQSFWDDLRRGWEGIGAAVKTALSQGVWFTLQSLWTMTREMLGSCLSGIVANPGYAVGIFVVLFTYLSWKHCGDDEEPALPAAPAQHGRRGRGRNPPEPQPAAAASGGLCCCRPKKAKRGKRPCCPKRKFCCGLCDCFTCGCGTGKTGTTPKGRCCSWLCASERWGCCLTEWCGGSSEPKGCGPRTEDDDGTTLSAKELEEQEKAAKAKEESVQVERLTSLLKAESVIKEIARKVTEERSKDRDEEKKNEQFREQQAKESDDARGELLREIRGTLGSFREELHGELHAHRRTQEENLDVLRRQQRVQAEELEHVAHPRSASAPVDRESGVPDFGRRSRSTERRDGWSSPISSPQGGGGLGHSPGGRPQTESGWSPPSAPGGGLFATRRSSERYHIGSEEGSTPRGSGLGDRIVQPGGEQPWTGPAGGGMRRHVYEQVHATVRSLNAVNRQRRQEDPSSTFWTNPWDEAVQRVAQHWGLYADEVNRFAKEAGPGDLLSGGTTPVPTPSEPNSGSFSAGTTLDSFTVVGTPSPVLGSPRAVRPHVPRLNPLPTQATLSGRAAGPQADTDDDFDVVTLGDMKLSPTEESASESDRESESFLETRAGAADFGLQWSSQAVGHSLLMKGTSDGVRADLGLPLAQDAAPERSRGRVAAIDDNRAPKPGTPESYLADLVHIQAQAAKPARTGARHGVTFRREDELAVYFMKGFGRLTPSYGKALVGEELADSLLNMVENAGPELARGTPVVLTTRLRAGIASFTWGARDYKNPPDHAVLVSDCRRSHPDQIREYVPKRDGKFGPREAYPRAVEMWESDARRQVDVFSDGYGREHRDGLRFHLEGLVSMHRVNDAIVTKDRIFETWERLLARYGTELREEVGEHVRISGKDMPRKSELKFIGLTDVGGESFFQFPGAMDVTSPAEFFQRVILANWEYRKERRMWAEEKGSDQQRRPVPDGRAGKNDERTEAAFPQGEPVPADIFRMAVHDTPTAADNRKKCWFASSHSRCNKGDSCTAGSHEYICGPISPAMRCVMARFGGWKGEKQVSAKDVNGYIQRLVTEIRKEVSEKRSPPKKPGKDLGKDRSGKGAKETGGGGGGKGKGDGAKADTGKGAEEKDRAGKATGPAPPNKANGKPPGGQPTPDKTGYMGDEDYLTLEQGMDAWEPPDEFAKIDYTDLEDGLRGMATRDPNLEWLEPTAGPVVKRVTDEEISSPAEEKREEALTRQRQARVPEKLEGVSADLAAYVMIRIAQRLESQEVLTDVQLVGPCVEVAMAEMANGVGALSREAHNWMQASGGRAGRHPRTDPEAPQMKLGKAWHELALGFGVIVSEARVWKGTELLEGITKGSSCDWQAVDYRDRIPLSREAAEVLGMPDETEEVAQCMVLHVTASLLAARDGKWPKRDHVQREAVKLRVLLHEGAKRLLKWLGQVGLFQSLGEAETRMHIHDAKHKNHDKDFHCLLVLVLALLDDPTAVALAVFRVDGLKRPHLAMVVGRKGGWESHRVAAVFIERGHMRSIRFEDPPTAMQLIAWAARHGVDVALLRTLTEDGLWSAWTRRRRTGTSQRRHLGSVRHAQPLSPRRNVRIPRTGGCGSRGAWA